MKHSSPVPVAFLSMLMLVASRAHAGGNPSAANSAVPTIVRLVGASGGVPDVAAGQFTVVARDLANNPVDGIPITLDLSNCPDLALCPDQMDPSAVTSCTAKTIQKITNLQGQVTFTVLGSSNGSGHASSLAGSARIFGGRGLTWIGAPSVASFDLDGSGGVGAGDLSAWLADFGSGQPYARSDFDGSGDIGAADLSQWLAVYGAGGSVQSCAASCP